MSVEQQNQREVLTQLVDRFMSTNNPLQCHALLSAANARGKSGVPTGSIPLSFSKLVTEGHRAVASHDLQRAGAIAEYYTAVAVLEARAIGLVGDGATDEQVRAAATVATYYLNRGLPVSRVLQTRDGGALLDQLDAGKLPWVQPAVLLKTMLLSWNQWVPELPSSVEEAEALLDTGALKVVHPHLHHALVNHVVDGTDATWWALTSAYDRVEKEVAGVRSAFEVLDVLPPVSAVSSVVDQFVGAVKSRPEHAAAFVDSDDDQLVVIGMFAPDLRKAYDTIV